MERGSIRGVFAPLASQGQVGERPAPGPIGRRSKGCGSTVVTLLRWSLNPHNSVIGPRRQPEEIYAVDAAADHQPLELPPGSSPPGRRRPTDR